MSRLLISMSHLYVDFGSLSLFRSLTLSINQGDCFALIGENGSGKTTLLRLLAGLTQPDEGQIQRTTGLTIGFLPQEVSITTSLMSVRTFLEEGPLQSLESQMERLLATNKLTEWEALHEQYERLGGYHAVPLEIAIKGLRLEPFLDMPMQALSSGERVRVALTKALMMNPDLLLLDEPTNHLDRHMQKWLQDTIKMRQGATVIVSHDRQFLNTTCSQLLELKNGSIIRYGGNYNFYLIEKERLLERQMQAYDTQRFEKEQLKQQIKAIAFSKPKVPPPSDQNKMAYDKRGEKHQKSLQRTLNDLKERLQEIEKHPLSHPKPKGVTGLHFHSIPLHSQVAIEFESIDKSFEEKLLLKNFSKTLRRGDRVIIQGANGVGKTTLLQCAVGRLQPDSGHIQYGSGVKIAYLDQEISLVPMLETPSQYFHTTFQMSHQELLNELHKAGLGNQEILHQPFSTLSVGQRKRLMLLSLILAKPNVLVLDEPTNHLDLCTLEAFEKALLIFEGAILAVSHDATFIEKIATERWALSI